MLQKPKAIIDASFWININKLDLTKELLNSFELYFTKKVEQELQQGKILGKYNPKDYDVFQFLKESELIKIKNPKKIPQNLKNILSKNSGKLYTIALAKEIKNSIVLTDDYASFKYCIDTSIKAITSVNFIVYLAQNKIIEKNKAYEKIIYLKNTIKIEIIKKALLDIER